LLFWSTIVTKVLATFIAVYGFFVAPLGWNLAIFAWVYAFISFLIADFLKVRLYRWLDRRRAGVAQRAAAALAAAE
jgi:H+-transporting ATPase